MFFIAKAKAADGWFIGGFFFFLLDLCKINSVLRVSRKGYLGESSKEAHPQAFLL